MKGSEANLGRRSDRMCVGGGGSEGKERAWLEGCVCAMDG